MLSLIQYLKEQGVMKKIGLHLKKHRGKYLAAAGIAAGILGHAAGKEAGESKGYHKGLISGLNQGAASQRTADEIDIGTGSPKRSLSYRSIPGGFKQIYTDRARGFNTKTGKGE